MRGRVAWPGTVRSYNGGRPDRPGVRVNGDSMHSDDIAQARFRTTRFEPGYDQREVDTFLERVESALRAHEGGLAASTAPIDADEIVRVRFTPTRFREGYHPEDVDDILDRAIATIRGIAPHTTER